MWLLIYTDYHSCSSLPDGWEPIFHVRWVLDDGSAAVVTNGLSKAHEVSAISLSVVLMISQQLIIQMRPTEFLKLSPEQQAKCLDKPIGQEFLFVLSVVSTRHVGQSLNTNLLTVER